MIFKKGNFNNKVRQVWVLKKKGKGKLIEKIEKEFPNRKELTYIEHYKVPVDENGIGAVGQFLFWYGY